MGTEVLVDLLLHFDAIYYTLHLDLLLTQAYTYTYVHAKKPPLIT